MTRSFCGYVAVVVAAVFLCAGCSSKNTKSQVQTVSGSGITAVVTPIPNPEAPNLPPGVPVAGTNDLLISLSDTKTNAPIVDASLTVTATTQLTGNTGNVQTGKSNGDGTYHVDRLVLPLSEVYNLKLEIDRPGKPTQSLVFILTPQEGR